MSNILFPPDDDLDYDDIDDDDMFAEAVGVNNGSHALIPNETVETLFEAMMGLVSVLDEHGIEIEDDAIEHGLTLMLAIAQEAELVRVSMDDDGRTLKITNI